MPRSGYSMQIQPVENGFLVDVGCMRFVFSPEVLAVEIQRWILSPQQVEKEYLDRYRPAEALEAQLRPGAMVATPADYGREVEREVASPLLNQAAPAITGIGYPGQPPHPFRPRR